MSRRQFLQVAGMVGSMGVLAACVPAAAPSAAPAAEAGPLLVNSGELIVWDVPNSVADMPEREAKEAMFKEAYPEIELTVDYFLGGNTDDFKMKSVTQMAADIYPDAIYFQNSDDWIYKGLIAPLDDYIDADAEVDWEDMLPVAQAAATWQGKRYLLPWAINAWSMYYNKEMLGEYGIKLPEEYLAEDRWTWNDGFLEICKAATRGEGPTKTWGANFSTSGYWGHFDLATILWSNDGDFYRPEPWRCTLDEPEAIASLQYVLDLYDKEQVMPKEGAQLPEGIELNYAAFMGAGIWMLSSGAVREALEQFGYDKMGHIRYPYGAATGYSAHEGGAGPCMATPTNAEHPQTGWVWHKWIFNEYAKVQIANQHGQAPAKKSLATDPGYLASFAEFESIDEWNYALTTSRSLLVPNNGSEAINLIMAEWDRVKLGEISVEEMAANVKPKVDELIADTPAR